MKEFNKLINKISIALQQKLPGYEVQKLMEPATRNRLIEKMKPSSTPKKCGVLVLIYPKNNKIFTVFIKRQTYDGVHSGQIAFPGGKYEKTDNTLVNTAIREANEEIGINPDDINIIGNLTELYIPPSNFNVLPILAYMDKPPVFNIDKNEVDSIIEISIDELVDEKIVSNKEVYTSEKTMINVPCYLYKRNIIWGATAMIISEFVKVVKND